MRHYKKGFTLIEVIVVAVVTSIGLLAVIESVRDSSMFIQKIRRKIIAINLAREGVEQVINIRNTNWQKYAGEKGSTRLKVNPGVNEYTSGFTDDNWFSTGNYIILSGVFGGQQYFYASGVTTGFDSSKGIISASNLQFSLCESGGIWTPCPGQKPKSKEGFFFRRIVGLGLYRKDVAAAGGQLLACKNGTPPCNENAIPKEYRFCSVVEYLGDGAGKVELCSVLTNFKE